MRGVKLASAALGLTIGVLAAIPASAFQREFFISMGPLPASVEGIAVGSDNNVYAVSTNGEFFLIPPLCTNCTVTPRQITGLGENANLLGLAFTRETTPRLVVADSGSGQVWALNTAGTGPVTASVVMTIPVASRSTSFLNAITFDTSGRIYVSDSMNGIIWRATLQPNMSVQATEWAGPNTGDVNGLLMPPAAGGRLFPRCCGANGIAFSNSGGRLLVANTGFRNIIQIPVLNDGTAGTPTIFVTGINGPDGIAVQRTGLGAGRIWVAANQSDEIVVIDNVTGRVIDKLGDFFGLDSPPGMTCPPTCLPSGLLFPASLAFSNDERWLYVSNPAFPQSPPDPPSIDTAWAQRVTTFNVVRIGTTFNSPIFPPSP
jgi:hypothetical protein